MASLTRFLNYAWYTSHLSWMFRQHSFILTICRTMVSQFAPRFLDWSPWKRSRMRNVGRFELSLGFIYSFKLLGFSYHLLCFLVERALWSYGEGFRCSTEMQTFSMLHSELRVGLNVTSGVAIGWSRAEFFRLLTLLLTHYLSIEINMSRVQMKLHLFPCLELVFSYRGMNFNNHQIWGMNYDVRFMKDLSSFELCPFVKKCNVFSILLAGMIFVCIKKNDIILISCLLYNTLMQ